MLRSIKDLENYAIRATDGIIGHVKDFYFDDEAWVVRYLVVETGAWLSSRKATMKYHIEASDGSIGHVQGLLVDEETWAIRYMVVDTSNWWIGHQVLIASQWIHDLSWFAATVSVNLTRQAVKDAPPYDSAVPLDRNQEIGLHKHYKRAGYWADEVKLENPEFRVTRPAPEGAIKTASDVATQDERFRR